MPSLVRLIFVLMILAGAGYGAMLALVTFVHPVPREMTQSVPASKFVK